MVVLAPNIRRWSGLASQIRLHFLSDALQGLIVIRRRQVVDEMSEADRHVLPEQLCDLIGRLLIAPAELPVGVVTALLGGPFFLWLLLSGRRSG